MKIPTLEEFMVNEQSNRDQVKFTLYVGQVDKNGTGIGDPSKEDESKPVTLPGTSADWLVGKESQAYKAALAKATDAALRQFQSKIAQLQRSKKYDFNNGSTYYVVNQWMGGVSSELPAALRGKFDQLVNSVTEAVNEGDDFEKTYSLNSEWWEKWKKLNSEKYRLDKDEFNNTVDVSLYGEKVFTYDVERGKVFTNKDFDFFLAESA